MAKKLNKENQKLKVKALVLVSKTIMKIKHHCKIHPNLTLTKKKKRLQ